MEISEKRKGWLGLLVVILIECFFFRNVLGNSMLFGDSGDGKLCTLLTEHWFKVFSGKEAFAALSMFWPEEGVIGYTDLLLGYGIIHSLLRALGINMYLSYKYTLVIIHFAGAICLYFFLYKKLKVTELWSVVGAMSFFASNVFACKYGHTQLVAISFLPMIIWLVYNFFEQIDNRKKKNLYAFGAITLFVLLLYTSWYIAFFSAFFMIIVMLCYGLVLTWHKENVFTEVKDFFIKVGWECIIYVVYAVLMVIPFALIYIPISRNLGSYSWGEVAFYLPEPIDLFNVTKENWLFGGLIDKMQLTARGLSENEQGEGFSLVFIAFFSVVSLMYLKKNREMYKGILFVKSILFASIIAAFLTLKLSSNGVSLWYFFYKYIPGFGAIRAVVRILFFLHLPLAILFAYFGSELQRDARMCKKQYYILIGAMFGILFVSEIRENGVLAVWNADVAESEIKNVSAPPEECEVFYIIDSQKQGKQPWEYQLKAFEIATVHSLKTINGYSGKSPQGWNGIWDVCSSGYEASVLQWVSDNGLTHVYAYDLVNDNWISYEERMLEESVDKLYPEMGLFPTRMSGLHDLNQGTFSWSEKDFSMTIKNEKVTEDGMKLKIGTTLSWYLLQNPELSPYIELWVNDEHIQNLSVEEGILEYSVNVPKASDGVYKIRLQTNAYFVPKEIGLNEDPRNLSLQIFYIGE